MSGALPSRFIEAPGLVLEPQGAIHAPQIAKPIGLGKSANSTPGRKPTM